MNAQELSALIKQAQTGDADGTHSFTEPCTDLYIK